MKTKLSPAIVGAFVIGAFALGVVALLSFGGINFFRKPQRFLTYFNESVHGLDLGSPVKFRGVRVGRVVHLDLRYDEHRNRSMVVVLCEFNRNVVTDDTGAAIDVADRDELQKMVDRGLRARLQVLGLATGLLYVELDLLDPKEVPATPGIVDARYAIVPSAPSAISEFQASASEILANLQRVDFAGVSRGLTALIADARKQLEGVDLKGVTEQWRKTGAQLEALASNAEFQRTFENLNAVTTDLRKTIAKLDAQIEPTSKELNDALTEAKKTMQAFNETAGAARNFISAHSSVGGELANTLAHLNEAADAVKRLADFLERNPNALITGKKRP